jgi:SEC-C motif domain protein
MNQCVCQSGKDEKSCCLPYLSEEAFAPTPEALMRSRYTAFAQANIDYIIKTAWAVEDNEAERRAIKAWMEKVEWLSLTVVQSYQDERQGQVEFIAKYKESGQEKLMHELSHFILEGDRWYYTNGVKPKVGRNDQCPCGSGKKFKKCCGP